MKTISFTYKNVSVTISKKGTAFADYPNTTTIVEKVRCQSPNTTRELTSDRSRYRVYYPKDSLGKLFTDIEMVMNQSEKI